MMTELFSQMKDVSDGNPVIEQSSNNRDAENTTEALLPASPWNYFLFSSFRTCYITLCLKSKHLSVIK